jgi:hypothetical protein
MKAKLSPHHEFTLESYKRQLAEAGTDPEMAKYILSLLTSILGMGDEIKRRDAVIADLRRSLTAKEYLISALRGSLKQANKRITALTWFTGVLFCLGVFTGLQF